jgi:hypothetical protein
MDCKRKRKMENKNKQGTDAVKFITSFRIRWYNHVKRTQTQRMSKKSYNNCGRNKENSKTT